MTLKIADIKIIYLRPW